VMQPAKEARNSQQFGARRPSALAPKEKRSQAPHVR